MIADGIFEMSNPEGIQAISPGSLRSSAPGVRVHVRGLDSGGVAEVLRSLRDRDCNSIATPGALLRSDLGLISYDPFGIEA